MNKTFATLVALGGICYGGSLRGQDEEDILVEPPPAGRRGEAQGPGGPGRPGMMRMFPMFAVIDEDENGVISSKELRRAITALKTLDQNEDGKLTEEEVRPQFPSGGPGGVGPGGPGGPPNGDGQNGQGRPPFGPPDAAAMVQRWMEFDSDQDGMLSKEELTTMAKQFGRPPQRQRPGENEQGARRSGRQSPAAEQPED